jgi:oligosaccharide repeat unit polymerase
MYKLISFKALFVYCIYIAPAILIAISGNNVENILPVCTSLLVVLISTQGILTRPEIPFSLVKIFNIFNYLFLGIVPIITYKYSIDYWDVEPFNSSDYLLTNVVIIFSIVLFNFSYEFFYKCSRCYSSQKISDLAEPIYNRKIGLYLVTISSLICIYVYYLNGFDPINVWTRGKLGDRTDVVEYGRIQYLFFSFFLIPMLSINLLLYGMARERSLVVIFILIFLLLFAAPPTSMPRFAVAAMYMPLMLLYLKVFSKKYVFPLSLVMALFILFPLLEIFRYTLINLSDISISSMVLGLFTAGHFDSYQSLMMILKDKTVTYGLQLVGALLFFIPRVLWPDKPIGSGEFMAEKLQLSFNNISANYFSEGYINFGYFGILVFVIVLAKICGHFDSIWQKGRLVGPPRRVAMYLTSLALLFFMLRGDLMSAFAFIFCFSFAIFTVDKIIKLFTRVTVHGSR